MSGQCWVHYLAHLTVYIPWDLCPSMVANSTTVASIYMVGPATLESIIASTKLPSWPVTCIRPYTLHKPLTFQSHRSLLSKHQILISTVSYWWWKKVCENVANRITVQPCDQGIHDIYDIPPTLWSSSLANPSRWAGNKARLIMEFKILSDTARGGLFSSTCEPHSHVAWYADV